MIGVNLPIIIYSLLTILIISVAGIAALFWMTVFFLPWLLIVALMFIFIPWVMWLSLPNTDKEKPFSDYLKNIYSTEVINSDNQCVAGEACDADY